MTYEILLKQKSFFMTKVILKDINLRLTYNFAVWYGNRAVHVQWKIHIFVPSQFPRHLLTIAKEYSSAIAKVNTQLQNTSRLYFWWIFNYLYMWGILQEYSFQRAVNLVLIGNPLPHPELSSWNLLLQFLTTSNFNYCL